MRPFLEAFGGAWGRLGLWFKRFGPQGTAGHQPKPLKLRRTLGLKLRKDFRRLEKTSEPHRTLIERLEKQSPGEAWAPCFETGPEAEQRTELRA